MRSRVDFFLTERACQDLQRIYLFFSGMSASVLEKVENTFKDVFELLSAFPEIGLLSTRYMNVREYYVPFGKGSFIIRYKLTAKKIEVAHIWHSREKRPKNH